jgi:hypothetical protein
MRHDDVARVLGLFRLSERDARLMLDRSKLVIIDPGDVVVSRIVRPSHFSFLIYGRWTTRRWLADQAEPISITEDRPGAWHGGFDTLDVIAPADVVCDVLSRILISPRPVVHDLLQRSPGFAAWMLGGFCARLATVVDPADRGTTGRAA